MGTKTCVREKTLFGVFKLVTCSVLGGCFFFFFRTYIVLTLVLRSFFGKDLSAAGSIEQNHLLSSSPSVHYTRVALDTAVVNEFKKEENDLTTAIKLYFLPRRLFL